MFPNEQQRQLLLAVKLCVQSRPWRTTDALVALDKLLEPPETWAETEPLSMYQKFYTPCLACSRLATPYEWTGTENNFTMLKRGLVYLTMEGAVNHAKTLLS